MGRILCSSFLFLVTPPVHTMAPVESGNMAMPRSITVVHAGLSGAFNKTVPQIPSSGTSNHQGMPYRPRVPKRHYALNLPGVLRREKPFGADSMLFLLKSSPSSEGASTHHTRGTHWPQASKWPVRCKWPPGLCGVRLSLAWPDPGRFPPAPHYASSVLMPKIQVALFLVLHPCL